MGYKLFVCVYCGKDFDKKIQLVNHIKDVHDNRNENGTYKYDKVNVKFKGNMI